MTHKERKKKRLERALAREALEKRIAQEALELPPVVVEARTLRSST